MTPFAIRKKELGPNHEQTDKARQMFEAIKREAAKDVTVTKIV